eukprot:g51337.t1
MLAHPTAHAATALLKMRASEIRIKLNQEKKGEPCIRLLGVAKPRAELEEPGRMRWATLELWLDAETAGASKQEESLALPEKPDHPGNTCRLITFERYKYSDTVILDSSNYYYQF